MKRQGKRERYTVAYPGHHFKPRDILTFIEMKGFGDDWQDLKLTDDDLAAVQIAIMAAPRMNELIRGTGGLRKLRYVTRGASGRRKAIRVCYAYFQEYEMVLLVVAYAKNEQDNIRASDRRFYREMIRRQKLALSRGPRH